jgi:type II secretory pathway pseudopilin PulG
MKSIGGYVFPALLIILGGIVFVLAVMDEQNVWVKLGAFLALLTGAMALLLQLGMLSRKAGMAVGLVCAAAALFLAFRNYRSVAGEIEAREAKRAYDSKIIQALSDIREAQRKYKLANGAYTGNLEVLRDFVKNGTFPVIKAIGQVPDSLTELKALELKLIVRDTIQVSVLDSTFRTAKALEGRVHPFNPDSFIYSPTSRKPFILKAGMLAVSGRNAPVVLCKDPSPLVAGDTLQFGSMEKPTDDGNWRE